MWVEEGRGRKGECWVRDTLGSDGWRGARYVCGIVGFLDC